MIGSARGDLSERTDRGDGPEQRRSSDAAVASDAFPIEPPELGSFNLLAVS